MDADKVDAKAASEFIGRLLHGVTAVHMHHLMTRSYAKHMALGELYASLQEKTDTLAEALMGCANIALTFRGGVFALGTDPLANVRALYELVETERAAVGSESHIQNIVDEIASAISSAIYKLQRLS